MSNYVQAESAEQFVRSSWQAEIERAKKFGTVLKNCTSNSCDVIFPDKKSMDAFVGEKEYPKPRHTNIFMEVKIDFNR